MTIKVYVRSFVIPDDSIDENGHVNNVVYVQWMQDIAVEHYTSIGGVEAQGPDATWVIREHKIKYLLPACAGEEIEIRTFAVETKQGKRTFQTERDEWPRELAGGGLLIRDVAGDLYAVRDPAALDPQSRKLLWAFID